MFELHGAKLVQLPLMTPLVNEYGNLSVLLAIRCHSRFTVLCCDCAVPVTARCLCGDCAVTVR